MNIRKHAAVCAALVAAGSVGCATVSSDPPAVDAAGARLSTLIPNKSLNVSPALAISVEHILLGAALYWAADPLAPNWQLEHLPLGADRVRIVLRKKRFATGGDGEAAQVFARRAERIARESGFSGYTVLEYTEGIESSLPLAQRVSQGVIRLDR